MSTSGLRIEGYVIVSADVMLANDIITLAREWQKLKIEQQLFPFTRTRAFQIVDAAMEKSGITKPDHVGTIHVLRHSGALERLKVTGNPRAVQDQLRHADARMTLRYMKTLSSEESMRIQQSVDFNW